MYAFTFHRPTTVRQAANMLAKNEDAKLLAGGHTLIPIMKQQRKGKIINIAAPSALRGSYGVADYAAAKGGIIALTKNAANELKSYNIQVNCISPVADTRMTEELTIFRREQLGIARRDREVVPPEAIAPAFLFFATSESDYVSGQLLEVGRT